LGHHAGKLRGGFDEEHAREERVAGEVPAQKGLVAPYQVFTDALLAGRKA